MKKVFVTGADGMLGSSICRELLAQGYEVKAMCLEGRNTNTLNGLKVEVVTGNILDKDNLLKLMQDCSVVIHIAALTNVWPRRSAKVTSINLTGTKNVMEAAEHFKMDRMIHIGTASSFGNGSKEKPGDENSFFDGEKFGMDYIDSKYKAQQMLLKRFRENNFPVVIINPTFMIGPFDYGPSSGQMLLSYAKDTLKYYGHGVKNFVCATDVAKAVVNAITKGEPGQCYIAGNENLEYKDFFMKVSSVMHKPFKMKSVPDEVILAVGFILSALSRINQHLPKLSYGMAIMAKEKQYFSSEKAKQILEMPQTPIEVGIKQCLDWFLANNYL